MARFFSEDRPTVGFKAPTEGMGSVSSQPSVKTEPPKKEPNREKQAQQPIRKTEGGRYDGADGYKELGFGEGT